MYARAWCTELCGAIADLRVASRRRTVAVAVELERGINSDHVLGQSPDANAKLCIARILLLGKLFTLRMRTFQERVITISQDIFWKA